LFASTSSRGPISTGALLKSKPGVSPGYTWSRHATSPSAIRSATSEHVPGALPTGIPYEEPVPT
jgi:hypothetical protein